MAPRVSKATQPSRVDARRNHELIVVAARALFASHGVDVSVREIAGHAGLGVGTLYRHFPTREDLVDAVLVDAFAELIAVAESALADADAWHGFTSFIEQALVLHTRNRGLKDVVETQAHGLEHVSAMRRRVRTLIRRLVERAQEQGTLRRDFVPEDVPVLFWASDRVSQLAADVAPNVWRRHLAFVLDGLRASAAHTVETPALTPMQLRRVGLAKKSGA